MGQPIPLYKGSFTNLTTGEQRSFSLNPSEIKDNYGHTDASTNIPGISHPASQDGHGTDRLVSFTLRLDADVGYRDRRVRNGANDPAAEDINEVRGLPFSIKDELNWYRSFMYTEGHAMLGDASSLRPLCLFDYGEMYNAFRCKMMKCNIVVTHYTNDLRPYRADVDIELKQKVASSVDRSSIYNNGPRNIF